MALIETYVNINVSGGLGDGSSWPNAYASLGAWEAGQATDLTADEDSHLVHVQASSGGDDSSFTLNGFITSSLYDVTVQGYDFPEYAIWDDDVYVLKATASTGVYLSINHVTLKNIQIQITTSSTDGGQGIYVIGQDAANEVNIEGCIIRGVCSGTGSVRGIIINDSDAIVNIYDTIIFDIISGTDDSHHGIMTNSSSLHVYNSTLYDCYIGMNCFGGTISAYNCIIANAYDPFTGTVPTCYNCCTDSEYGANPQGPLNDDWEDELTDPDNYDFSLKAGGNCIGNGTDNPGSGLYSTDIIGESFTSTWDIGAFMYASSGTDHTYTIDDGIGVQDTKTPLQIFIRSLAETLGITDAVARAYIGSRVLAETIGLTDATGITRTVDRSVSESIGLTDTTGRLHTMDRSVSETIGLTDATGRLHTMDRSVSDMIGLTDAIAKGQATTISDALGITDGLIRIYAGVRSIEDAIGFLDTVSTANIIAYAEVIADSIGIADDVARISTFIRTLSDDIGVLDAIARIHLKSVTINEALGVSDSVPSHLNDLVQVASLFLMLKKHR